MGGNEQLGSEGFQPAERVVAQEDGGEGFLLQLDTGRYYTLNRTGMVVWRALEAGTDPVDALRARYPAAPAGDLARDVEGVLAQLASAGLATRPA
jgi:hypothetical protein